ncbi:MAG: ABC transporter ATP-binding protein/permease [Oscillospiraceae bacterium]|jgi:ATP-binding cassette subfamily B protein|nr:ABC transporter ATP-binding protein/permease [Oscillospiraceae bacterium]
MKNIKPKLKAIQSTFADLGFLVNLYRKYALAFLLITVGFWAFWGPANSLLNVYISRTVIGHLVDKAPYWTIVGAAAILYGLMALLRIATACLEYVFQYPRSSRILQRVNREIFVKALGTDYRYYDSPEFYSDFTWAAQNLTNQMEQARNIVEELTQNFTQFIAMAAYISVVGPWVLAVTGVGVVITAVAQYKHNMLNYKLDDEVLPYEKRMNFISRMFYTIDPAADLKATRVRGYLFRKYDDASAAFYKTHRKFNLRMWLWSIVSAIASQATTVVILALIVRSVTDGETADIALYSSLLVASGSLNNALWQVAWQLTRLNKLAQYTHRIRKFFETVSTIEPSDGAGGAEPGSGAFALDIDGVTFAYNTLAPDGELKDAAKDTEKPAPKQILLGLTMHIAPGEKIAIVGENGVGKSTLMKLLLRLYDAGAGEIRVDGKPLAAYDVRKLRDRIGIAFQDSVVYSLPLRENMQVYREADTEKLKDILRKVGLTKLLDDDGALDAELTREFDDKGVVLSGGEMQKFALARLLVGDFGLLILDEPTAALDPLAEYELNKLILDRSRPETTIVIAHRLSTVRDADRIYLIDGGVVAECGSHDELVALGGKYYEMFTKQAENYVK